MPYSYTLSTVIPASPAEIYEAWLDSIAHAEMTGGGDAVMSDEVGAEVSAWNGYITGRNVELVPGERIVQSWRTTEFDDETEDSLVTILLQETEDGTLLTLEHSNVPDQHKSYEEGGWQSNYFEPMVAYFSEFEEDLAEPEQPQEPKPAPEPEPEMMPPPSAPARAARKAPGARARNASGRKRRTGGLSARKATPRAAAKKRKVTARGTAAAKKAAKPVAKKAAKKSAKSSTKKSAQSSAKRRAAKTAARSGGSGSRKAARRKR